MRHDAAFKFAVMRRGITTLLLYPDAPTLSQRLLRTVLVADIPKPWTLNPRTQDLWVGPKLSMAFSREGLGTDDPENQTL
jgi:hypothetical protein